MNLSISIERRISTSLIDCSRCPINAGKVNSDDSSYKASANRSNCRLLGPHFRVVAYPLSCVWQWLCVCVCARKWDCTWLGCMCRRRERERREMEEEREREGGERENFTLNTWPSSSLMKFALCHRVDLGNIEMTSKWNSPILPCYNLPFVIKLLELTSLYPPWFHLLLHWYHIRKPKSNSDSCTCVSPLIHGQKEYPLGTVRHLNRPITSSLKPSVFHPHISFNTSSGTRVWLLSNNSTIRLLYTSNQTSHYGYMHMYSIITVFLTFRKNHVKHLFQPHFGILRSTVCLNSQYRQRPGISFTPQHVELTICCKT